ncbi:lysophospholipid acyltransferase family protein [Myxococcaceae bacterium GXIMD 01537]
MIRTLFALLSLLPERPRRALVRKLMDVVWGRMTTVEVSGRENIPEAPCLFICNHLSNADGFTLHRAFRPRRVLFLAGVKLQSTTLTRLGTEAVDTIFIKPNSPDIEALRSAVEALKAGQSILVFPEGSRSRGGGLLRAKKGVALIAKRANVPVVPVALTGTEKFMPIDDSDMGGERRHRAHLTVRFGEPFHIADLKAETASGEDPRQALVDAMMQRVAALLPPEYRGVYSDSEPPGDGRPSGEQRASATH